MTMMIRGIVMDDPWGIMMMMGWAWQAGVIMMIMDDHDDHG